MRRSIDDLKAAVCYVAEDFETAEESAEEKQFRLPDGNVVSVDMQRFQCPELLFKPQLNNIDSIGLSEAIASAINKSDLDVRPVLQKTPIMLDGAGCLFPGM